MEDFTTNQIEQLIDGLNFYYSENDDKNIEIIKVNSECARVLYAEIEKREIMKWEQPVPEW